MKISEQWLRATIQTRTTLDTISNALTMAGLEVDEIAPAAPALDGIVIGRILSCRAHPQADRLQICDVDVAGETSLTIVCGAPNARAGGVVPVAQVGARLPNGTEIEATEIRGQASAGMLCSAAELGLAPQANGLWELAANAPVGMSLEAYLGLPDRVLDIDLTPNRGDCLSVRGVSRELAFALDAGTVPLEVAPLTLHGATTRDVAIKAPDLCVAYAARCIDTIRADADTPVWMAERLRRGGIRRINLPVDIGNYVMLELGQPMHAFDADRLDGPIRVRRAEAGERIVTLDDENVVLSDGTLVIADGQGPVAIAGMIGGLRTAVDETTTNVVFESACFTPAAVAGRGREYKIQTDSLHRFERGVDPELFTVALDRATQLLLEHGGGSAGPATVVEGEPLRSASRTIGLRHAYVERLLGQAIDADWIEQALPRLGIVLESSSPGVWTATPPSWRFDLEIEADLIEEIARLHGYDRLTAEQPSVELPSGPADGDRDRLEDATAALLERGYSEAITYSFVESSLHAALTGEEDVVTLDNPISDHMTEMRRTLWAGLLPSWEHNVRRQQATVRLYERGLCFLPDPGAEHGIDQQERIAGLISGMAADTHWDRAARPVDFFDIKGDVEALFGARAEQLRFEPVTHPGLHPGRAARILLDGRPVGHLGQLAPKFAKRYKNKALPYLFDVLSEALAPSGAIRFEVVSEQPAMRRDLALVVAESVSVAELIDAVRSVDDTALRNVEIFDLFRGGELEAGFKSVAFGLIFQDNTSTLTDARVEASIRRVMAVLEAQCGARIRGE